MHAALLHELQVHQIELVMQNEELQRSQAAAEEASKRYCDLFDFARVGYFLWDREGRILEVNLARPPCWAWTARWWSRSGSINSWRSRAA